VNTPLWTSSKVGAEAAGPPLQAPLSGPTAGIDAQDGWFVLRVRTPANEPATAAGTFGVDGQAVAARGLHLGTFAEIGRKGVGR
jgi:hypothetical protein